jgi:anti-sigma-K factor RskA
MTPHDDAMLDLVAAYAVGAIDATTGECAQVRAHLAQCAICREEFKVARAASAAIGLSAAQSPPVTLRDRILASLPDKAIPIARARRSSWLIPVVAAAAVLIAVGVWWNDHRARQQSWAVTCAPGAVACHASGTVTLAGGVLRMQMNGLAPLPAGKQYQAWLIPPGGPPKPEPAFSRDASGAGSVDIAEMPVKGALVAITVEKAGGSQTPTTKPFLIAKLD